jgi:NTP pyrophosphatase (non-canonical NTP hydrolase)
MNRPEPGDTTAALRDLQALLREFAERRDWRQFHTPKNLAMALSGEAGEVASLFQWLTPEESVRIMARPDRAHRVRGELADVFAYLLQLADVLDVDLADALHRKVALNEERYPAETARGRADKYDELGERHP